MTPFTEYLTVFCFVFLHVDIPYFTVAVGQITHCLFFFKCVSLTLLSASHSDDYVAKVFLDWEYKDTED